MYPYNLQKSILTFKYIFFAEMFRKSIKQNNILTFLKYLLKNKHFFILLLFEFKIILVLNVNRVFNKKEYPIMLNTN